MTNDLDAKTRVLVIDDEPINVKLLTKVLTQAGFGHVEGVTDSTSVIDRVAAFEPDIILLDLHMPPPDGFELLERLSADQASYLPIVVITADITEPVRQRALQLGAADFLTKPFPITETLLRIRNLSRTRRLYQELERHAASLSIELDWRRSSETGARERAKRVMEVLEALEANLTIVYQPIVDLATGQTAGVEALSRFSALPTRSPDQWFIDAAEAGTGVRLELEAVRLAIAHARDLPPDTFLSLNLSAHALRSPALSETLAAAGDRPIVIELTEHEQIDDYVPVTDAMYRLRSTGTRLAIDDAGSGYSSLHHILRLRPDFIKLDIRLITDIDIDPARRSLVAALAQFSSETGALLIAEGIETAAQLDALRELGAHYGQGFHLAPPAPLPLP